MDGMSLTLWTVRCSLLLAFVGMVTREVAWRRPFLGAVARLAWTVGCIFFLAHVACAFHFHHHWSHENALEDTARQTGEVFGFYWGGGLWFNYAFTAAWVLDSAAMWWRRDGRTARTRRMHLRRVWLAFFWFMAFNSTVVFESGMTRWAGLVGCAAVALLWLRAAARQRRAKNE